MNLKYELPIAHVHTIADQTYEIGFDITGAGFSFKAGQYISVIFPELEKVSIKDAYHEFSIASGVDDAVLTIAFRASDSLFKQKLLSKKVGDTVLIEGPFGLFYPPADATDVVYIAGGIGITAFRGALHGERPYEEKVRLYTFDRNASSTPYRKELQDLAKHGAMELHQYTGLATAEHLSFKTGKNTCILIAGPNGFVQTVRQILLGMGIMKDSIRTEEFTGYA